MVPAGSSGYGSSSDAVFNNLAGGLFDALLPHGASIGDNYGPIVVSNQELDASELPNVTIAVPGTLTSAFLALSIHTPKFKYEVVPFDQIINAITEGRCDADGHAPVVADDEVPPEAAEGALHPHHVAAFLGKREPCWGAAR